MGRGLSKLQKTILEMAYERFLADKAASEHFHGTSYNVYVGPTLPSDDYLQIHDKWERRWRNDAVINYYWSWEDVRKKADEEIACNKEARTKVERMVEAATPELYQKHGNGECANWRSVGEDKDDVSRDRFLVGSPSNNAPEVKRLVELLKERGLPWGCSWDGGGMLYTREILELVYGFESKSGYDHKERTSRKFNPKQIGEERYNRARASVSRALKRLANRTLIDLGRDGIATITLEGIAELTGQTVNEVCFTHNINRTDSRGVIILGPALEREPDKEALEAMAKLQNMFNPPPPPLADAMYNAILAELVHRKSVTEEAIKEAFEDALQRIKDITEKETVNDVFESKVS